MKGNRSNEARPLQLDAHDVKAILDAARQLAGELHGKHTALDPAVGARTNRHLAQLNADLLRLAALCRAAASGADMIYWRVKGYPNPADHDRTE